VLLCHQQAAAGIAVSAALYLAQAGSGLGQFCNGFNVPDIDPEILKHTQALLDANRLEASRQNLERRREAAQLESISSTEALKQDVRQLTFEVRQLLDYIRQNMLLSDDALRDYFEHLSHRIEGLETGMMLVLMNKLDSPQVKQQAQTLINENHQQRLRSQHVKNLTILEERAAKYGSNNVPLDLQNEIDAEREALRKLE
jgi:hypothetical protein